MNLTDYWLAVEYFATTEIPEFSTTTWIMATIALVIFIAISMYIFRRLKEASKEDAFLGPHALLTQFRDMRDNGNLSEEEFKAIKLRMADQIAEKVTNEGTENESRKM